MKLTTQKLRQVIRLLDDPKLSQREIGRICGISPNTVKPVRKLMKCKSLTWALLCDLDDEQFEQRLFEGETRRNRKPVPNWLVVHNEMRNKDMTLSLVWEEYRQIHPDGLAYTQFTRHYKDWAKTCKLSLRQIYPPGEKIFVDFCGRTMPVRDAATGETRQVQVFVACLGASGYLFAVAVATQTMADWLKAHKLMLNHLGGSSRFVVPDNLKAGVLKHNRKELILNPIYAEFAEHYDFIVLPARPGKPKDKSLAEVGVKIVQRWVLARLRNQVFFSLEELNTAISFWMEKLNEKTTRTYSKSRLHRFLELDAPALKALRDDPYPYSDWLYNVRVNESYLVEYQKHFYSVPHAFAHRHVDIRISNERVDIFHKRRLIASHAYSKTPGLTTLSEHLSEKHRYALEGSPETLLTWAEAVGPATFAFMKQCLSEPRYYAARLKAAGMFRKDVRTNDWQARLESACAYALTLNCLSFDRLRSIIQTRSDQKPAATGHLSSVVTNHENLRGSAYYDMTEEAIE